MLITLYLQPKIRLTITYGVHISGGSDTNGAESLVLHISINIQCTGAIMCAVYFVLYRVDYTLYCTLYRAVGDRIDNNFHSLQYQSWPPYTAQ